MGLKSAAVALMICGMGCMWAQDTLHSPLTIPLQFSGNFGEIRTGHFHTGLDIRTQGQEGFPVLAAQDGRISRVKVSSVGYGLALYLDGGGLTTVYAHLSAFAPAIEDWLMRKQYSEERWAWDGAPDTTFRFAAGDTIGWSGNSGRSFGPHLHFEVRDARSQHPINPLHWTMRGAGVTADPVPPEFRGIWVVPERGGTVEGEPERFRWSPAYSAGVQVSGHFRIGVEGFDRLDNEPFMHGPYGLDVWLGDSLVYSHRMDTLDFSTNGDVSAHIDLPSWQDRKARVHRVQRLPGNRLDIYQRAGGEAPWWIAPGDTVALRVRLLDLAGNATEATMALWGRTEQQVAPGDSTGIFSSAGAAWKPQPLDHRKAHYLVSGPVVVDLPAYVLYGDANVALDSLGSGRYRIWSDARITRSDFTLTLPVAEELRETGQALVVCAVDDNGIPEGTWVSDERRGTVQVKLDHFGTFEVRIDTLPPTLGAPRLQGNTLRIAVSDNLTGIERWEGRCGDQWMRWSMEKGVLTYRLSDAVLDGREKDTIRMWAIDGAGNLGHTQFTLSELRR